GASNPLVITSTTTSNDYIVDVKATRDGRYVFATSFNLGEVRIADFGSPTPTMNASPGPFLIGNPATGVSANGLAVRPGNFEGPEVFALTGAFPGPASVASIQTSLKVSAP
ncbi:MAG: hypothetical protein L0216_04165, partial [Planctomycetales bacterium]|nr:hypothetical protein [Planctomycetales bacterium]